MSRPLGLPLLDGELWTVRDPSDTRNLVLKMVTYYRGNVATAVCRIAELYRDAVRLKATGVILAHQHPSGDPTPSPDDLHVAAEALAAGLLTKVDAPRAPTSSGAVSTLVRDV